MLNNILRLLTQIFKTNFLYADELYTYILIGNVINIFNVSNQIHYVSYHYKVDVMCEIRFILITTEVSIEMVN